MTLRVKMSARFKKRNVCKTSPFTEFWQLRFQFWNVLRFCFCEQPSISEGRWLSCIWRKEFFWIIPGNNILVTIVVKMISPKERARGLVQEVHKFEGYCLSLTLSGFAIKLIIISVGVTLPVRGCKASLHIYMFLASPLEFVHPYFQQASGSTVIDTLWISLQYFRLVVTKNHVFASVSTFISFCSLVPIEKFFSENRSSLLNTFSSLLPSCELLLHHLYCRACLLLLLACATYRIQLTAVLGF